MRKHAAFTFVSKNYFAYAQALAQTYLQHHPDNDFLIVLVDRADGYVPARLPCGAEVIEMGEIALPDVGRFIYRYSIMELNTAVKPFTIADLFARRGYETLVFLDPDILVFRPLTAVYEALERASIVLIPHMRRPYYDDALPADVTILQSGTYNLGFIALRNTETTRLMVDWWMTKLYRDCVVDIPKGLFVDQKWIDLVPGMFPDHAIVYGAGYNAAYWNLHERPLVREGEGWLADGEPLVFFHFSGYLPFAPRELSKHQNRHRLEHLPALKALTDHYREALLANGYEESSAWPYAFDTLANGVRMPIDLVRCVMQWASRSGVPTPCPIEEPDAFCRFLMSRAVLPNKPRCVPLFEALLGLRGDVLAACPHARDDHGDAAFRAWLRESGCREYRLEGLLAFEDPDELVDPVADAFAQLRKAQRQDVFDRFPAMWRDKAQYDAFVAWVEVHGVRQLPLLPAHAKALRGAWTGIGRILNVYFMRGDLQAAFPHLVGEGPVAAFAGWLREQRYALGLDLAQISLFEAFARGEHERIEKMRYLYGHRGVPPKTTPGIYAIDERRYEIGSVIDTAKILDFLCDESTIEPVDQYLSRAQEEDAQLPAYERYSVRGLAPARNNAFVKRVQAGIEERRDGRRRVNFAGYLEAETGMGESARSLRATLGHAGVVHREMRLPNGRGSPGERPVEPELFGWPMSAADVSITVANADSAGAAECFLPKSYWAGRNVGYWVWETQELPLRFRPAARRFDEIWTPSRYSAEAIAKTVPLPVRVLPHTLDFEAIARARPDRRLFGLPEKAVLFGFIFDPLSSIERKNVAGLVKAFGRAFRDDDDCYLVLKANGMTQGAYDYELIRASSDSDRVLWLEATLGREETFAFLKSLDAYASLHRAEGFGLTCAEAMALGLPVVASGYSGNLEFMTAGNSLLVPTAIVQTHRPYGPYPAGTCWGEPDLEAAAGLMRSLLEAERRRALGEAASRSVREALDPGRLGALARGLMDDLLGPRERP